MPECGILKHSHFPQLNACSIARGRTFQQIQELTRVQELIQFILESHRICMDFMHNSIKDKVVQTIQNSA